MKATIKRAIRRQVERHGQAVDLILKTHTGTSEYGEEYDTTTETVQARVTTQQQLQADRSHREAGDVENNVNVFIKDTVGGVTGGGGEGATEVDVSQDGDAEYVVLVVDDQDSGVTRLGCELQ